MTDVQTLPVDGAAVSPPLWLLAELTHRCPLHCVFCYNPVDFARRRDELSTAQWIDVLRQARQLGAAQLGFCLLYTSPSPRDRQKSRMPSSA